MRRLFVLLVLGWASALPKPTPRSPLITQQRQISLPDELRVETSSLRGGAETATSIAPSVFNIVKSIVGAGVLGLPAGIAAFGDHPSAILPAGVLLVAIGSMAAFGFVQIGLVCRAYGATSYQEAWNKSVNPNTGWIPTTACTLVTLSAVLCYSMILADTIPALASSFVKMERTPTLITFTTLVLLPLCSLRNLSSLAPFSLMGILGMVYTCTIMVWRWAGRSYPTTFASPFPPKFGTNGWKSVFSSNAAILLSMLSTAFMAHYNVPSFYWELKDRFIPAVWLSFAISMAMLLLTAAAGFGTFGSNSQPLILNNYTDGLMALSRLAVTVSLIFSYPLAFRGGLDGITDLLRPFVTVQRDVCTVALLVIITSAALVFDDIGIVLALKGATLGNLLVYIFPSMMMIGAAKQFPEFQSKVLLSKITCFLGLVFGCVGTYQAIQNM